MRLGPFAAIALLAAVGAGGWYWLDQPASAPQEGPPVKRGGGGGGGGRGGGGDAPVPVSVETARKETIPVYREGIGNVQPLLSVTVRAQIDGRLSNVDFVEGQMVRKGDVLARIDPVVYKAQYDQTLAKKAQDEATLANARIDLERYRKLAQSNAGPKQQADQQAATVAQLEAQVRADDASIANAKAFLDYTVIASPIDGRAGLRQVDPGNLIRASDANGLVLVTQITPIAVVFTLPQRDLPLVVKALGKGEVPVEVLGSDSSVLARGALQTFDNQIDISTGTVKLKAVMPNAEQKLWPGQFVNARIVVDTLTDATTVPTPAIRRGPAGTFVYTVGEDGRAAMRPVEVALQDAARSVVSRGIAPGDRVVTIGFSQLSDGKVVRLDSQEAPAAWKGGPGSGGQRGERQKGEGKRDSGGGRKDETGSGEPRKKGSTKEATQ